MQKISVVIPCYNEEEVIRETYNRLITVMKSIEKKYNFELIFVNDGSKDKTIDILRDLSNKHAYVKVLSFSRNFGHQIAITAGIDVAKGDAVVLIDADLQDPPELIVEFLQKWEEGYQVVYAVRQKREGETWFKKTTAALFYRTLKNITDVDIPLDTGDFRLMGREVVEVLKSIKERHRFIRGLVSWVGFKQIGIEYDRGKRFAGDTKYPLKKMVEFSLDAITSFSFVPLKIASLLGTFSAFLGLIGIIIALYLKLATNVTLQGWTSLMLVVLFLGGVQLLILGVIGEYLGRVYDEIRERPLYVIAEKVGFES
ncbi:MAG: glycosyltransferase [Peptococcaceae bacterium BICA1-8]|nr:MAG: glycosyltransferase [Peptococcaceae bacterium BICA1-8]